MGVNAWDEPKSDIKRYVEQQKLKHRILLDGRAVAGRYGVTSVPRLLWINAAGTVVDVEVGFHSPESLQRRTEKLLAATP